MDSMKMMKKLCYLYIVLASVAILIFGLVITKICAYVCSEETAESLAAVSTAFTLLVTYFLLFFLCISGGLWLLMAKMDDSTAVQGVLVTFITVMVSILVLLIYWRQPYSSLAAWHAEFTEIQD